MDKPHKYSSVQIELTSDMSEEFLALGKDLISESSLFGDGFEPEPHVTVLYGIHEDYPTAQLVDVLETHPKFDLTLGMVSLFDEDDEFDVVKAEILNNDLFVLNSALLNVCHYTLDHPEYIPHATIAFAKKGSSDHLTGHPAFRGLSCAIDSVMFSSSDGTKREIMLGVR